MARKKGNYRDQVRPPGLHWLEQFVWNVERGSIDKKVPGVGFAYDAFRSIIYGKENPSVALQLAPSANKRGMYSRSDEKRQAMHLKVEKEVLPVWNFFRDYLQGRFQSNHKAHGARSAAITAAEHKFHRSNRKLQRFYSAYQQYFLKHTELYDKIRELPSVRPASEQWWQQLYKDVDEYQNIIEKVGVIAFDRKVRLVPNS